MYIRILRFAPSPNGYLHLGHAYSALFNHDMARDLGGRLLLRIEDIDVSRCRPQYEAAIYQDLGWLGISLGHERAAAERAVRRLPGRARQARSAGLDLSEFREPQRDRRAGRRAGSARPLAARSRRGAALSERRAPTAGGRTRAPAPGRRTVRVAARPGRSHRARRRIDLDRDRQRPAGPDRCRRGGAADVGRCRASAQGSAGELSPRGSGRRRSVRA